MKNSKTKSPIYTISINKVQTISMAVYGTVLLFLGGSLFSAITGNNNSGISSPLIALLVYLIAVAAHEAVHGFFFKVFGGNPKYGVGLMYRILPYAYATSPGQAYTLTQMIIIGMSPFFVICAIAVFVGILFPITAPYAAIAFAGNFAGAIGDMWLMRQVWRFRKVKNLALVDLRDGIAVHGSPSGAESVIAKLKQLNDPLTTRAKFKKVWLSSSLIVIGSAMFALILLNLLKFNGHILIGTSEFPLFEYVATDESSSFQLGVLPIVVGMFIFSVVYTWVAKRRT